MTVEAECVCSCRGNYCRSITDCDNPIKRPINRSFLDNIHCPWLVVKPYWNRPVAPGIIQNMTSIGR